METVGGIMPVWGVSDNEVEPLYSGARGFSVPVERIGITKTAQSEPEIEGTLFADGRNGRALHGIGSDDSGITQTPLPVQVAGGSPLGPLGKAMAALGFGGDVVTSPYRQGRYNAIRKIHPESTGTIGAVARQSYQYVMPLVPMPRPFNAFPEEGNPITGDYGKRTIDQTIPPALEGPRWNYTSLDTDYIQQQHDIMLIKAQMAERGM